MFPSAPSAASVLSGDKRTHLEVTVKRLRETRPESSIRDYIVMYLESHDMGADYIQKMLLELGIGATSSSPTPPHTPPPPPPPQTSVAPNPTNGEDFNGKT